MILYAITILNTLLFINNCTVTAEELAVAEDDTAGNKFFSDLIKDVAVGVSNTIGAETDGETIEDETGGGGGGDGGGTSGGGAAAAASGGGGGANSIDNLFKVLADISGEISTEFKTLSVNYDKIK